MGITIHQVQNTSVFTITGSIDALTAGEVSDFLNAHMPENHPRLVADLGLVDFLSSAGLRAILGVLKETRQRGGDLRLAAAQPGIEKILKLSGFAKVVKTFPTVEEAVASFDTAE